MCRMIAKVSPVPSSILNEMLLCPVSLKYLSKNGRQLHDASLQGEHNDGCGMAFLQDGRIEIHKRDQASSWDESYQSLIKQVRSTFFIAHNRRASLGLNASLDGAHPFYLELGNIPYVFSHNGNIFSYHDEAKAAGTSDSKIFLHHLAHEQAKFPQKSIAAIVASIAREKSYDSLSAFLLSADKLQVWRIFNDTDPEKTSLYEAYYTLYMSLRDGNAIISSEPLDDGNWQLLQNKSFLTITTTGGQLRIDYTQLVI